MAGDTEKSARSATNHSSCAEAPAWMNTHLSCGTPAACAAATLMMMTPDARSTCMLAHNNLVYGSLIGRLVVDGVANVSASTSTGLHANRLPAAMRDMPDHS